MRAVSAVLIPFVLAVGCATKAPVTRPAPEPAETSAPPEIAAPVPPAPAPPPVTEEKAATSPGGVAAPSPAQPSEPPSAKPAVPSPAQPTAPSPTKPTTPPTAKPAAPSPAKPTAPSTAKPATPNETTAKPASPTPATPKAATPPATPKVSALDLDALKAQLKATRAIGVFTKLTLKNQVDDLLDRFRDHHAGKNKATMTELRRSYDLLMMKVLSLLQDRDQRLASDIVASREAIWGLLADRQKFAALDV
jgi:hypothetical protein